MEKKKTKNNSNKNIRQVKLMSFPLYTPLKIDLKNTFENKGRKNSVFMMPKFAKNLSRFKNITQEQVLKLLSKNKKSRIDVENRMIADYLTQHYQYFNQIKDSSRERFLKLISVLSLENVSPNEIIINIGKENNNFYVIFEGSVIVYRKYNYKKDMTLGEFCDYLKKSKRESLIDYRNNIKNNSYLDLNFEHIISDELSYLALKYKIFNFTIEEAEEIGTYSEGYSFGELSLINKKNKDMIIKSVTKCRLISVSKFDFNRILRTLEEKRLEKKAYLFKKNFPLFKNWQMEQLITLFNYFSQEIFHCEDYVFKQNDENEYIYFIEEGNLTQSTNVSFSWYLQFQEYIGNFNGNLLGIIKNLNHYNSGELHNVLSDHIKRMKVEHNDKAMYDKYPFFNITEIYKERKKDLIKLSELCSNENQTKIYDNFYKIKFDENELNNPEKIYKIPIATNDKPCILGLEEVFELKKKFTTIKCNSGQVRAKKIKIIDLLKVLYFFRDFDYIENFKDIIIQKKTILCETIKSHLQKIGINFEKNMNDRYEKMTHNNISSYRDKDNSSFPKRIKEEILIGTKLKCWDNCSYLDNVLDTSLHLLNAKTERQIQFDKNMDYHRISNLFKLKRTPNEKSLFWTKTSVSKVFNNKNPLSVSCKKKIKLKNLFENKEDISKKEKLDENFFDTSIIIRNKKIFGSRNKKVSLEEKKNEDKIYMKTCDNLLRKDRFKNLDKSHNFNFKNMLMNSGEFKKFTKPLKKYINYKASEEYYKSTKDDTYNKKVCSMSILNKVKENNIVPNTISKSVKLIKKDQL